MSLVCVHHVYWWFSKAYGIYIRSVSGNRIFSQISYVMIYSGSKSSTHDTHLQFGIAQSAYSIIQFNNWFHQSPSFNKKLVAA